MSVLPPSLFEALEADASLWPGALARDGQARLEQIVAPLPAEVRDALVSALVDPERNDWARAAVMGLRLAATAGAVAVGMATDDLVEMTAARGERFGLVPLGFRLPAHPWGPPADVRRLLDVLDGTFGERRYLLYLRRPVPAGLDPGPICRAVQLWLGAIDRGERAEKHAVYEDDDVAIDLTVLEPAPGDGGRLLTIGPVTTLERLGAVDARMVEAATRSEESIGDLPLVMALAADLPWRLPRGYVQQLLYGTPDRVDATTGAEPTYEAELTPNGRSLFSDPACRAVAAMWWLEPADPLEPFGYRSRVYENPWAARPPALPVAGPRFAPVGEPRSRGAVVLRWGGPR